MLAWLWVGLLPAVITLGNLEPPARLEAVGFAGVAAVNGANAVFGNPATIFPQHRLSVLGHYQGWYEVNDLRLLQTAVSTRLRSLALGLGIRRKGVADLYAETTVALVLAMERARLLGPGTLRMALRPRWFQVSAQDTAETWNASQWLLDAGVVYQGQRGAVGIHWENLARASLRLVEETQQLARRTVVAAAWRLPANVTWSAAYVHWNGQDLYRVGVEAWFTPGFALRFGLDEKYLTLGMGLTDGHWSFDFAGRNVFPMGAVYSLAVGYEW